MVEVMVAALVLILAAFLAMKSDSYALQDAGLTMFAAGMLVIAGSPFLAILLGLD